MPELSINRRLSFAKTRQLCNQLQYKDGYHYRQTDGETDERYTDDRFSASESKTDNISIIPEIQEI